MPSFSIVNGGFRPVKEVELDPNELNAMKFLQKLTRERSEVHRNAAVYNLGRLRATMHELEEYNRMLNGEGSAGNAPDALAAYHKLRATETVASCGLSVEQEVMLDDLQQMLEAIEMVNMEELEASKERLQSGQLQFLDLAELYLPGTKVIGAVPGLNHEMAFLVRSCWFEEVSTPFGKKQEFFIELEFFASVGERFSLIRCVDMVGWFRGVRDLGALFLRPLSGDNVERLEERGKQYSDVAVGTRFLECRAGTFHTGRKQKDVARSSRVMVDVVTAMEQGVRPAGGGGNDAVPDALDRQTSMYKKAVRQGRLSKKDANVSHDKALGLLTIDQVPFFDTIPKERLWNCWPSVPAFSFVMKAWGLAEVSGLAEIQWREEAWLSLVLPKGRKNLIKAVVQQQRKVQNVDVIKGKGEGTTFLLFGASGTGKTLTAEALAEVLHKPLYVLSAGEMGTTPAELERTLSSALQLCTKWDCICLIDEADIFLEARTGTDVLRNALVCVMLRQVEYHTGVLFLTTNKARGIDPAVQSRLTLALKYDHLSEEARQAVWTNLLQKVRAGPFEIDRLATPQINGRQIKNCIKLAMALAKDKGTELTQQMLESTLGTICTFQQDLQDEDEPDVNFFLKVLGAAQRQSSRRPTQGAGSASQFVSRAHSEAEAAHDTSFRQARGSNASQFLDELARPDGSINAEDLLQMMLSGQLRLEKRT